MKIRVAPQSLKPGQLFDARQKGDPEYGHFDCRCERLHFFGDGKPGIRTETGDVIPPDYDFFIEISHPELVSSLAKPGADILASLTPEKCNLLHHASNLAGEVGEIWDAVKKHIYYEGPPPDVENIKEEAGDLLFYLQGLLAHFGLTMEECKEGNIAKLSKRYADGYSNAAAHARADKASAFDLTKENTDAVISAQDRQFEKAAQSADLDAHSALEEATGCGNSDCTDHYR